MATFGSLKPKEVLRALQQAGFYIHEQSGSHVQLKHPTKPGRVPSRVMRALTFPNPSSEASSVKRDSPMRSLPLCWIDNSVPKLYESLALPAAVFPLAPGAHAIGTPSR
jgi:hypothetical protein